MRNAEEESGSRGDLTYVQGGMFFHPDIRMKHNPVFDRLTALADPIRARLLLVLERHELTVSELRSALQLPQSTVSSWRSSTSKSLARMGSARAVRRSKMELCFTRISG